MLRHLVFPLVALTLFACAPQEEADEEVTPTSSTKKKKKPAARNSDSAPESETSSSADTSTSRAPKPVASGTVAGHAFKFAYGIAFPDGTDYAIKLSNRPVDCSMFHFEDSSMVSMLVPGTPPAQRTYPMTELFTDADSPVWFRYIDPTCAAEPTSGGSKSGGITITKVDATQIEGSVDLSFESRDDGSPVGTIAGTFKVVICPDLPEERSCKITSQ